MVDDDAPFEGWEARRMKPPSPASWALRDARKDARLLLRVVRARFARGEAPFDLADRLAAAAQDERLAVRTQRLAATFLARMRMATWARDGA